MLLKIPAAFVAATLLVCGCAAPDRYYRLSGPAMPDTQATGAPTGIGPVSIPAYIDRPELVFESSSGELQVPEGHRWSGSLKDEVTRVLTAGVQAARPNTSVVAYPWPLGTALARHIPVTITELHARSGEGVTLSATWNIGNTQRRAAIQQPIVGDGYAAITDAQSLALELLARRIAASY